MSLKTIIYSGILVSAGAVHATPVSIGGIDISASYDIGVGKPYTLLQLGDNGGDPTSGGTTPPSGDDKLEITSNSSVFGSTLRGTDGGENNKITTSKVTGSWDSEDDSFNDFSSAWVGSENELGATAFNAIASDAVAASTFWAGQTGTDIAISLNSSSQTITGVTGGANVFNVTDGFILNSGARLKLTGGGGDFFVFNISENQLFSIQSNSIIELGGDIEASEVLFNVLGNVGAAKDDGALIGGGSIFQGTLLAPGRKVEITQNHFFTFDSEGFMGTQAPETTEITAAAAIAEKDSSDSEWGGLWGQVIAGGTLNFTESDIAHHPFMTMPVAQTADVPETGSTLGLVVLAALGLRFLQKRFAS